MVKRGLLIEDSPGIGPAHKGASYSLKPSLGIMLAARCRPAFIVLTETAARTCAPPALRPRRPGPAGPRDRGGMPAELPSDWPADFPNVRKLGPLGRFYRYVLLSRDKAAEMLAELAIPPPHRSGEAAWLVSAYRHPDRQSPLGYRLSVQGDGTKARLDGPGDGDPAGIACDVEGSARSCST